MRLTRTSPASKPDTNTTPAFAPRLPHAYPHAARLCGSFVATLDLVAPLSRPPTRRTAAHARRDERKRQADAMRESLREVQMRDIYLRLSQQKSAERARDDVRNESVVDGPAATELQESVWNNMANAHQITAKQHAARRWRSQERHQAQQQPPHPSGQNRRSRTQGSPSGLLV